MIDATSRISVNPFVERNASNNRSVNAKTQTPIAPNPRGSLFEGFDVGNWDGSPIYQPDEHNICYFA